MNKLAAAVLLSASFFVHANPCSGMHQTISPSKKAALELTIAKQLKIRKVAIINVFKHDNWRIIHVGTYTSDERFLFYHGDPLKTVFVTEWGGVAARHEGEEIMEWVKSNAKGIPDKLAACFARFVIFGL